MIALFTAAFEAETDPDRYYVLPFALIAVFVGLGVSAALEGISSTSPSRMSRVIAVGFTVALLVLPENAIVIAPWVYATPLAYGEYVERSLGYRIVETLGGWCIVRFTSS